MVKDKFEAFSGEEKENINQPTFGLSLEEFNILGKEVNATFFIFSDNEAEAIHSLFPEFSPIQKAKILLLMKAARQTMKLSYGLVILNNILRGN